MHGVREIANQARRCSKPHSGNGFINMPKNKKSKSIDIRAALHRISGAVYTINNDRIQVYAGQASLFIIISSIPFMMLLFSFSSYFIPDSVYDFIISFGNTLPSGVRDLYMTLIDELYARPAIKLVSLTAITSFWTASRGIASVRGGIVTVYKTDSQSGILRSILLSLMCTAFFIILIIAIVVLILFGRQLSGLIMVRFAFLSQFRGVMKYRIWIFLAFLSAFFSLVYYAAGRKSPLFGRKIREHIPGAIFSAGGWVLFSYFYSLYTVYFSGVSYVYGSLAAIVLLMLWLYFCMMILLLGAEVNKYFSERKIRVGSAVPSSTATEDETAPSSDGSDISGRGIEASPDTKNPVKSEDDKDT